MQNRFFGKFDGINLRRRGCMPTLTKGWFETSKAFEDRKVAEEKKAQDAFDASIKDGTIGRVINDPEEQRRVAKYRQEQAQLRKQQTEETAKLNVRRQMAKDFQDEMKRDEQLGLTPDEVAFYDALANNESAVRVLGDDTLKKMAIEITEKLRHSTTVDWQVRESVRAKLRVLVRRTLQKYKYPPDQEQTAIELVMQQAEALSNAWTTT